MEKGMDEKLQERETAGGGEMYRGLERKRDGMKRCIASERSKCRIEVRSETPVRSGTEGQRKRSIVFPLSFFSFPQWQKDREIRSLVPFPIW